MTDIAAAAGVSKPVLYSTFRDKSELAAALADRFLGELDMTLLDTVSTEASPRATLRRTIGRPVMRWQRWLASRAAGVSFVFRKQDVTRVRRRPTRTWYRQLDSWHRRRSKIVVTENPLPPEGQQHASPTS